MSLFPFLGGKKDTEKKPSKPAAKQPADQAAKSGEATGIEGPSLSSLYDHEVEEGGVQAKSDEEIMTLLSEKYYDPNTDPVAMLFESIPENFDSDWIHQELYEKSRAWDIINSRLAAKVISNYQAFVKGMNAIRQLGDDLQSMVVLAKNGRLNLAIAKDSLTNSSLVIFQLYRKKRYMEQVFTLLQSIKNLKNQEAEIKKHSEEGNFPKAIEICLDCRNNLLLLQDFVAVRSYSPLIQSCYQGVLAKMDALLLELIQNFDPTVYRRILIAHRLIGKDHRASEKLEKNFVDGLHAAARTVLSAHVLKAPANNNLADSLQKSNLKAMSMLVKEEQSQSCLLALLEAMYDVIYNYHLVCEWHQQEKDRRTSEGKTEKDKDDVDDFGVVGSGLERYRANVWDEIQRRLSVILTYLTMTNFQIDEYLEVLDSTTKFIEIGEDFSRGSTAKLRSSLQTKTRSFFFSYHRAKLEDFKTILGHEMWQVCPVSPGFGINDLKEVKDFISSAPKSREKGSFYSQAQTKTNPFSKKPEPIPNGQSLKAHKGSEGNLAVNGLKDETIQQDISFDVNAAPVLTSSSNTVARCIGKYLQMMKMMQPIAPEIFNGIASVYEYYVYAVYSFFGSNDEKTLKFPLNPKLKTEMNNIKEKFLKFRTSSEPTTPTQNGETQEIRVELPTISQAVDLSANNNFGLLERSLAIESIIFLNDILLAVKAQLLEIIPKSGRGIVNDFYTSMNIYEELRIHIYKSLIYQLINFDGLITSIANTKFDIKETGNESPYVDTLIKEFKAFAKKLDDQSFLPSKSKAALWDLALPLVMENLVEGYSRVKKCTNQGRAQMSLDFQTFQSSLFKISPVRPLPQTAFVDNYIKGFYENDITVWAKEHPEYSNKQSSALISLKKGGALPNLTTLKPNLTNINLTSWTSNLNWGSKD